MIGVGPAGRAFRALRDKGRRRSARRIGGRRRVGGRVEMINDYYSIVRRLLLIGPGRGLG